MKNQDHIARYKSLMASRSSWEAHWQEVADNVLPRKNQIQRRERNPGEKRNNTLFESTAIQSNELLSGALHGLLTNPAVQFFELSTGVKELDDMDDVRKWLQEVTRRMHQTINHSNFQTEVHEFYLDLGSIGTASMFTEEDDDIDVRFASKPIQEIFIKENHLGEIDTIYRPFCYTADQIVSQFEEDMIPDVVKKALEKKEYEREFEIIHCVYPDTEKYGKANEFQFASKYILVDGEHTLEEKGYYENPYIISRWTKTSGETYGRSPAMNALPDVKMVNRMMETTLQGAQLTIRPPLLMPDDGIVMPLKMTPNGINYYRSNGITNNKDLIQPLITNARVDFGFQLIDRVVSKIRQAFFVDQLKLQENDRMTATEVLQRTEDSMRLLGPMLGRQQFEFLKPFVNRVYGIMYRKGKLPEIPNVLKDKSLDFSVRYTSLIAKAQRSSEVQNILRTVQAVGPFVSIQPEIMDYIDGDAVLKFVAEMYGLPADLIRDEKVVKQLRQMRAEAAQKLERQEDDRHDAEVVDKVVPAAVKAKEAESVG